MENSKIENLTPEAIQAEKEQLKETPEAEVRASLIEKYGLDEDTQYDLIDSLVQDKLEDKKALSTVIGQKINWREKAQAVSEKKPEVIPQVQSNSFSKEDIMKEIEEKMEQKELDTLEFSDELKQEIKNYAKLNNVPVKTALKSSYISFMKDEETKRAKNDGASISSSHKTMANRDFSEKNVSDFDLKTEEGRKGWAEYKKWYQSQ